MAWLKHVLIDIGATLCILLATLGSQTWAAWAVWIYTPLLLLLKLGALSASLPRNKESAPDWFYHLLYGINVAVLAAFGWYWEAGGWVIIWILSAVIVARQRK